MKTLFTCFTFVILCIILSSFKFVKYETKISETKLIPQIPPPITNKFIIGALGNSYDSDYSNSDYLGFDIWHNYSEPYKGWFLPNMTVDPIDNINHTAMSSNVVFRLNENSSKGYRTFMDRPKIQYLAFGQRSDYQCEPLNQGLNNYWFHSYETHQIGTPVTDTDPITNETVTAVYCTPSQSTDGGTGWIAKDLISNREQANYEWNYWNNDDEYKWYVMPKIRINPADAQTNKKVCKIEVIDWNGRIMKIVEIHTSNFSDPNSSYNGEYLLNYFPNFNHPINQEFGPSTDLNPNNISFSHWYDDCKIDFRIWYYNECDMWIDFVRVENETARQLYSGIWDLQIEQEVEVAISNGNSSAFKFYIEEFEFNIIPCIGYLNEKIKFYSGNSLSLTCVLNHDLLSAHIPYYFEDNYLSPQEVNYYLIEKGGLETFLGNNYPLEGYPDNHTYYRKSWNPNTLPIYQTYTGDYDPTLEILTFKTSPDAYDDWLQNHFDFNEFSYTPSIISHLKLCNYVSKTSDIPFLFLSQAQVWFESGHKLKEPTNEELSLMTNLAVSYGAKGNLYFWYAGFGDPLSSNPYYARGLTNPSGTPYATKPPKYFKQYEAPISGFNLNPRLNNAYGQEKWENIKSMNQKLEKWGPVIMTFDNDFTNSYVYRLEEERNDLLLNTYFNNVVTYKPGTVTPPCSEDNPGSNLPPGYIFECNEDRYLQIATFNNFEPNTKYFMITNRRCSPVNNLNQPDGKRIVHLNFDNNSPHFSGTTNWQIIEIGNSYSTRITFNKNNPGMINLGEFLPGEGRLYKIVPVINSREGGVLIADETIESGSVSIGGPIYNDGYNITVEPGASLNFSDSGKIIMNGGRFICGEKRQDNGTDINMTSSTRWNGITFNNCELVDISSTKFEKIDSTFGSQNFALKFIGCDTVKIRYCKFITETGIKNGAISINYLPQVDVKIYPLIDLLGNTFECNGTGNPSVQIMNYGDIQNPVLIRWNIFNGNNSSVALMLSNVTAGVVRNNFFSNYNMSINPIASYVDLYGNTIDSPDNYYHGMELSVGSNVNLNTALYGYYIGGLNSFKNYTGGYSNIWCENSFFDINMGYNIFDIDNSPYHFDGYMTEDYLSNQVFAENNCFKINGNDDIATHNVLWNSQMTTVNFRFEPYICEPVLPHDFQLIYYGDIEDTLWTNFGGGSGGISGKSSFNAVNLVSPLKFKFDSLNLHLRKNNLYSVKRIATELLDNYTDSSRSLNAVQPLYYATLVIDDENNSGISILKAKLENLISANSENEALVLRCNYFIQKCKVRLGDYSSALLGFYNLMQNYPYNWEGVVAGWDYSAIQLLLLGGSSGGESISLAYEAEHSYELFGDDPKNNKKPVKKTVEKTLERMKEKNEHQIKKVEGEIRNLKNNHENGKYQNQSKILENRLQQKKIMKEIIKPRKPNSEKEHIGFVNSDIQKIYSGFVKSSNIKENISNLMEYKLEQNYPNPFNPVTNIKFELPIESKVTIIVYDVIGRKIAKLINNEIKQAGSHVVQFNGKNFASGIYFYTLKTNDFVETKRMMLIK